MILILPGYSPHNKNWADDVAKALKEKLDEKVIVHNWQHWDGKSTFSPKREVESILQKISDEKKVVIIAKSVGTMICAKLMEKIKPEKIILCGIPSVSDKRLDIMKVFGEYPAKDLIVFQNKKDPFASFEEVKRFVEKVNKDIMVVEKPREDHNYPYEEDFIAFLST